MGELQASDDEEEEMVVVNDEDEVEELQERLLRSAAHERRKLRRERWNKAGARLLADGWAVIDDFLGPPAVQQLRESVMSLHREQANRFMCGRTGGGRHGKDPKLAETVLRGDQVAVIEKGDEDCVHGLPVLLRQADELVTTMARGAVIELRSIISRSQPMLACYPGDGARYIRHLDNPGGTSSNGRLLTLLYYLNEGWTAEHGGVLRLHRPDGTRVDIEPLLDRAVCFWSDERTPHEVLPASQPRWAISTWYHQDEPAGDELLSKGRCEPSHSTARMAKGTDGGVSECSFGNSTEQVEAFLLALFAMKGGEAAPVTSSEKSNEHFRANLRSW